MNITGKRQGFTLVELIVVFIIIIAAVLFFIPYTHKDYMKTYQATCASKQRQIAIAIQMYVQDNDEIFFPEPKDGVWPAYLHIADEDIYDCPTQKSNKGTAAKPDYGFSSTLYRVKLNDLRDPSRVMVTADLALSQPETSQRYEIRDANRDIDWRHNKGAIFAFADGHVAYEVIAVPQGSSHMLELAKKGYDRLPGVVVLLDYPGEITVESISGGWARAVNTIAMPVGTYVDAAHPSPKFLMTFELNGTATGNGKQSCTAVGFHVPKITTDDRTGYFIGYLGASDADHKVIGQSTSKQYGAGGFDWKNPASLGPGIVGRTPFDWNPATFTRYEALVIGNGITTSVYNQTDGKLLGTLQGTLNAEDMGSDVNRYLGVYLHATGKGSEKATMRNLKIYGFR